MFLFRYLKLPVFVLLLAVGTTAVQARDFSVFSNQELLDLRRAMGNASPREQEEYRMEWQYRLQKMSEEDKEHYTQALEKGTESGAAEGEQEKVPFVIQGRGYDRGEGIVIFGGMSPDKGKGKGSGK